jgi:ribonuclease P protein subunit POP4
MITQENITLHELIGLDAEVVKCNNAQTVGLYGKIIDETKSMLILNTAKGIKKIPKANAQWKFSFDKTETLIDGNLLTKRPQERVGAKT